MAESEDKESKTEEASEKKIRDTIEKGQLPFAKEAPVFASFVAILVFVMFFARSLVVQLGSFLAVFMESPDDWPLDTQQDALALYRLVLGEIGRGLVVLLLLLMAAGITASLLQNTPRLVLDRIQPKYSRISLKEGWKRIFGLKGQVEFLKALGKLVFAGLVLVFVLQGVQGRLLAGMITQPVAFTGVIRDVAVQVLASITLVMMAIAAADVVWSRFNWKQDLRMTRQEVKDELKQTVGDPIVRMRIRSAQRDRARQRMMAAVPKATLVIANPTHFAVALRYVRDESPAPVVVAKGQDLIALKIREIAEEHGIPVFEDVALARSMYKQVSVDSMIPSQFYQAVAELVRIVYSGSSGPAAARNPT